MPPPTIKLKKEKFCQSSFFCTFLSFMNNNNVKWLVYKYAERNVRSSFLFLIEYFWVVALLIIKMNDNISFTDCLLSGCLIQIKVIVTFQNVYSHVRTDFINGELLGF